MVNWNYPTDAQLLANINIPVEGLGITMRAPTAKEILMIGEANFVICVQIFKLNKKTMKITDKNITNWMIFNKILNEKIEGIKNMRVLISNFLSLFFLDKVMIGPNSLMVTTNKGIVNIEPEDFDGFQLMIQKLGCAFLFESQEEQFKPKNKKAKQIAEKMKAARARLNKIKALEDGTYGKPSKGILWKYLKFVSIATSNSLKDALDMSLFQLNCLTEVGLAKESFELDVQGRMAGAKTDKDLKHWLTQDYDTVENTSVGTI